MVCAGIESGRLERSVEVTLSTEHISTGESQCFFNSKAKIEVVTIRLYKFF